MKTLDNLMEKFHDDQPKFYEQYIIARRIIDNPTHHKIIYGIVTNEKTKEVPLN